MAMLDAAGPGLNDRAPHDRGPQSLAAHYRLAERRFARKRLWAFALPALVLAYLAYAAVAFDLAGLAGRMRPDNAVILLQDAWSYQTEVERDNRRDETSVAIEGERRGTYAPEDWPGWVTHDGPGAARVDLGRGYTVALGPVVVFDIPGYGALRITPAPSGITVEAPPGPLPDWINASDTRVAVTTDEGRLTVTKARSTVIRRFPGWEMFFFTLDSPFHDLGWGELARAAVSGPELRPGTPNLTAMAQDFWYNPLWHHGDVAWALFETLLMAFLGTMGAALISLPLAFLAARGFASGLLTRFGLRRFFDFLRGVDGLIWTVILARAFGPGPMTGALAILLTDTGSFGKLFSEALETTDQRQVEGLRATGAGAAQRNRFGVLPQMAPVIVSQVLYHLESNTRSATVIGAIVGGGIGLLLTQAMQTQRDWEDVTYYIILIVALVMGMDRLSGLIRRRLIGGDAR